MGSAIYTGVSGLLAHQRKMDVTATNIANINTVGYRGSRMMFQDLFSQTLEGGTPPSGNLGGTNPEQVGLGVGVGGVDMDQSQGSLLTTGISSDLAVQGNGFFILNDGAGSYYTRDGSFKLNNQGELVDPSSGMYVQGYSVNSQGAIDTNAAPGKITIPMGTASIVRATQSASLAGNLDSDAEVGTTAVRTVRVYDSLGTERDIQLTFTKRAQVTDGGTQYNAWLWNGQYDGANDVTNVPASEKGVLLFDDKGNLYAEGSIDDGATDTFKARATLPSANQISVPASLFSGTTIPVTPFQFAVDFSKITDLSGTSDFSVSSQDGFPRGVLQNFSIGSDGVVNGAFSNGLTQVVGQVALADFGNVGGLARRGDNLFTETPSSGFAQIGTPTTGGRGTISGGVLEGSNVDLGMEFSNMIVTQRGYQANARTITTADTMMQEAVNLIR